jgi:DNA repair protein RadC
MACKYTYNNIEFGTKDDLKKYLSQRKNITDDILNSVDINPVPRISSHQYSTDQWVGMAMRRSFKMAADEGFDRVAWVTGEQSAERYDLSKQVDKIVTEKVAEVEGLYFVDINMIKDGRSGEDINLEVENGIVRDGEFKGKPLEEIIGKDLAKEVIENESQTIQGEGLKVGGEGMKTFYNSILPKVAKKEAQRFDKKANVEVVEMNDFKSYYEKSRAKSDPTWEEYQELSDADKKPYQNAIYEDMKANGLPSKQLSIPLTETMKTNLQEATPLFQVIGEQGATNLDKAEEATYRMDNLGVAREMEQAGKTPKEIRLATGWERGADKKWRYEILDGKIINTNRIKEVQSNSRFKGNTITNITYKVNSNGTYDVKLLNNKGKTVDESSISFKSLKASELKSFVSNEIAQLIRSRKGNNISEEWDMLYDTKNAKAFEIVGSFNIESENGVKLSEILDNKDLFKAYPKLKNQLVYFSNERGGAFIFNDKNKYIRLNDKLNGKTLQSVLLHEIQHAIQDIEGFAKGGNLTILDEVRKANNGLLAELHKMDNIVGFDKWIKDNVEFAKQLDFDIDKLRLRFANTLENDVSKEYIKKAKQAKEILSSNYKEFGLDENSYGISNQEYYKRLAGEVESRNVEKRKDFTPEQRRQTLLQETEDVARQDQIFLEQNLGVSESNANFENNENKQLQLDFSQTQEGVPYQSNKGANYSTRPNNLQQQDNQREDNRNRASLRAVWTEQKNIQFTGTTKIESAEDVAKVMSLLENKAVEHAFAVHIDQDGNSHIQFLSIGGVSGTVIDTKLALAGVSKFNSKKVYLVHNHPSGTMKPSQADIQVTRRMRQGLKPMDIELEHVIVNTFRKEYIRIDQNNDITVNKRGENTFKETLTPLAITEQELLQEPFGKIKDSKGLFGVIQNFRFSAMPKTAMLLLDNQLNVLENYVLQNGIEYKDIATKIGESLRGNRVVFYGNQNKLNEIKDIKKDLKALDIDVLDHIVISSDNNTVQEYYESMQDNGKLFEHQKQYGTSIQFQILGKKGMRRLAAEKVNKNLPRAVIMEKAGQDPKIIYLATGWERGADSKWRFELYDSNVKFKADPKKYARIPLVELIDYPDLFKAYPKAKKLSILLQESVMGQEVNGAMLPNGNIIINPTRTKNEMLSTLMHELQHFVQTEEGFTSGGGMADAINALKEKERNLKSPYKADFRKVLNYLNQNKTDQAANELEKIKELKTKNEYTLYQSLAGEVEARNVQNRLNMSEQERAEIALSETETVDVLWNEQGKVINKQPINRADQIVLSRANRLELNQEQNQIVADANNPDIQFSIIGNVKQKVNNVINKKSFKGRDLSNSLEESVRAKNSIKRKAKKLFDKTLRSRGGVDKNVAETVRQLDRDMANVMDVMSYEKKVLAKLISNTINKKDSRKVKNAKLVLINNYLSGQRVNVGFLDNESKQQLNYFRTRIDEMSDKVIAIANEKLLDLEKRLETATNKIAIESIENAIERTQNLIKTINNQKGKYMTRSYQAFTDPKYLDGLTVEPKRMSLSAKRKIQKAVDFLVQEEDMSEEKAMETVVIYLNDIKKQKDFGSVMVATGKAKADFLKKRQNLPEAFRELLGESKDPLYNYIRTVYDISSYVASMDYQNRLRKVLLDSEIATYDAKQGYRELTPKSQEWGILSGLWVSNDFYDAFQNMQPLEAINSKTMKIMVQVSGYTKVGKTIWSPTTVFRNFWSGMLLLANNGSFFLSNPKQVATAWNMAWDRKKTYNQTKALREELIKEGVLKDGVNSGELRATLNDMEKEIDRLLRESTWDKVSKRMQNLYAFGDDFYKVIGYLAEKQRFIDAGMSENEARAKAGERVRGGMPTYSYLPKGMKMLRRFPFAGTFVSFPFEVVRTTKNNALYVAEDFKAGRIKMAMQRLTGMIVANIAPTSASLLSRWLMGWDDDDEETLRQFSPPWQENSLFFYIGDKEDGKPKFLDFTALVPSEIILKPMLTAIGKRKDYDTVSEQITESALEVITPYAGEDLLHKTLREVLTNQTSYDTEIYNANDNIIDIGGKLFHYSMRGAGPGVYNNITEYARANNVAPGYFGKKITGSGREYTNADATFALFGFRVSSINYYTGVKYAGTELLDQKKDVNYELRNALKTNNTKVLSDEKAKSIVDNYMSEMDDLSDKLYKIILTGKKVDLTDDQIKTSFGTLISKSDFKKLIENGKLPYKEISKQSKETFLNNQKNVLLDDPEKYKLIKETYEANFKKINELIKARK